MSSETDEAIRKLTDRRDIVDVLHRYCTALDTLDWTLLATCFTEDAVAEYHFGTSEGYPAIEAVVRRALERLDASHHLVSNHVVEVGGDRARATCYLHAQHVLHGTPGGDTITLGGTYTDDLARTPEGWRIERRRLEVTWRAGNEAVFTARDRRPQTEARSPRFARATGRESEG